MAYSFRSADGNEHRVDDRDGLRAAVQRGVLGPETQVTDGAGIRVRAADLPDLRDLFGTFAASSGELRFPREVPSAGAARRARGASVWPEAGFGTEAEPMAALDLSKPPERESPLAELEELALRRRTERMAETDENRWGLILPAVVLGVMVGGVVGLSFMMSERDSAADLINPELPVERARPASSGGWHFESEGAERYSRLRSRVPNPPIRIGTAEEVQSDLFRHLLNAQVAPGTIRMAVDEIIPAPLKSMERPRKIRLIIDLPPYRDLDATERIAQAGLVFGPYVERERIIISSLRFDVPGPDGELRYTFEHEDIAALWRGAIDLHQFLDRGGVPRDDSWDPDTW